MRDRISNKLIGTIFSVFLFTSLCAEAQQFVIIRKGGMEPVRATGVRYKESTQEFIIVNANREMTIPASQVERVESPKPAALAQAEKLISGAQYDAAITILKQVIKDYNRLQWDDAAKEMMADALTKKGDVKGAMDTMKNLPRGAFSAAAKLQYWSNMLASQKYADLQGELDDSITKGGREEAAVAQVMRGNLRKAQNKMQDALLDYLRTVILFQDIESIQPEAYFKAAEAMDSLRDPRATDLRKQLVQKYPNSEFARKVGAQ